MLEVAALGLSGGWFHSLAEYHKRQIASIFSENNIDALLSVLDPSELDELTRDMKILGFPMIGQFPPPRSTT